MLATTLFSVDSLTAGEATDETDEVVSISALLIDDVDVEISAVTSAVLLIGATVDSATSFTVEAILLSLAEVVNATVVLLSCSALVTAATTGSSWPVRIVLSSLADAVPLIKVNPNKTEATPIVTYFLLHKFGSTFQLNNTYQEPELGIKIYPRSYFCYPERNKVSYTVHLFDNSWGTGNKGLHGFAKELFKKSLPSFYGSISDKRGIKGAQSDLQILENSNLKFN